MLVSGATCHHHHSNTLTKSRKPNHSHNVNKSPAYEVFLGEMTLLYHFSNQMGSLTSIHNSQIGLQVKISN